MKSIILARVSTEEQESNPAQVMRLKEFAKNKGFSDSKIYEIEESSTKAYRKKFQEILDEIKKTEGETILFVDTIDRLQRSFRESVVFDDLRKEGKVEIYFYRENLHLHQNSNSSELIRWDMGVMFARSYVLQLGDNVKRRFEQKRKAGEWTGPAPFGYKNIPLDEEKRLRKDIVPHEENSKYVIEWYEKYTTGEYSYKKLAKEYSQKGITTDKGKPVHQSFLHFVLSNPFYYGVARSNKYGEYEHKYQPLISKKLWDEVQKVSDKRNNNPTKTKSSEFIFGNLMKCANCGCSMTAELKKNKYVYYSCTNAKGNCKRLYTNEQIFIKQIKTLLDRLKLKDSQIAEIVAYLKKNHENKTSYHNSEIARLQAEYKEFQAKIDRLLDLRLEDSITQADYDRKHKKLIEQRQNVEVQLEELGLADESYHITANTVLNLAKRASEIFESSEVAQKQQILKLILQNPVVKEKRLEYSLRSPFNTIFEYKRSPLLRGWDSNPQPLD
tara:strand:- start:4542 stop:6038 length:1497 start_codon:yes stop_codon:yes gene_type:complete